MSGDDLTVQLVGNALVWRSGMAVDGDGAPNCYSPNGSGLLSLDYLANAGSTSKWWGLVCNSHGIPYVQQAGDPYPGYYISPTSLVDRSRTINDPRRYVNSSVIPYITCTRDMRQRGAMLGDVAMVFYGAAQCAAVVADVGPHPGEGSIALAEALGMPSSPKNGGVSSPVVSYAVMCGSARGWPRATAEFQAQAQALFDAWGGLGRLGSVLASA